jgi:hypothetical protein
MKLIIFVGGTCGSVNVQTFNDNLKELHVIESKRNAIRKGLVYELLNAQDTVLCCSAPLCFFKNKKKTSSSSSSSYFAQRSGERSDCQNQGGTAGEVFQGLGNFE